MKKYFFLLLIGLAALAYYQFSYLPSVSEVQAKSPSSLLAPYVSACDTVFTKLSAPAQLPNRTEIKGLEMQFRSDFQGAPASDRPVYKQAVALCQALNASIEAREKYVANLEAMHANPNSLTLAIDKKTEQAIRQQFFDDAVERRWTEAGKPMQENIRIYNGALKKAESRSSFAPPDLPTKFASDVASWFKK